MLPTKLPEPLEEHIRFVLRSTRFFDVFGDVYSDKRIFLHLDWKVPARALPSVFHELIRTIAEIRIATKEAGFTHLNVIVPESLVKFESILGFQVVNVYTNDDGVVAVHMMQETE